MAKYVTSPEFLTARDMCLAGDCVCSPATTTTTPTTKKTAITV